MTFRLLAASRWQRQCYKRAALSSTFPSFSVLVPLSSLQEQTRVGNHCYLGSRHRFIWSLISSPKTLSLPRKPLSFFQSSTSFNAASAYSLQNAIQQNTNDNNNDDDDGDDSILKNHAKSMMQQLQGLTSLNQTPIGSFTIETWQQAEQSLRWILLQQQLRFSPLYTSSSSVKSSLDEKDEKHSTSENSTLSTTTNKIKNNTTSVTRAPGLVLAFRLLDRMVQEYQFYNEKKGRITINHDNLSSIPTSILPIKDMIRMVLQTWLVVSENEKQRLTPESSKQQQQQQQQQNNEISLSMTPQEVWDFLCRYRQGGILIGDWSYHDMLDGCVVLRQQLAQKYDKNPNNNIKSNQNNDNPEEIDRNNSTAAQATNNFSRNKKNNVNNYSRRKGPIHQKRNRQQLTLPQIILEQMDQESQVDPLVRPTMTTYKKVIAASFDDEHASERAYEILQQLLQRYQAGWSAELQPDRTTYQRVINLCAKDGKAELVESLLQDYYDFCVHIAQQQGTDTAKKLLQPTGPLFVSALFAWGQSDAPDAAERASQLLDRFLELEQMSKQLQQDYENPEDVIWNDPDTDIVFLPAFRVTTYFFNSVMHSWCKNKTRHGAQKVQDVYDRMVELYNIENNNVDADDVCVSVKKPDRGTYRTLIKAWSRVDPQIAEDIMWQQVKDYQNGRYSFRVDTESDITSIIMGWYHTHQNKVGAEKCGKLLQFILAEDKGYKSGIIPVAAFGFTIQAWAGLRSTIAMEHAELLVHRLEQLISTRKDSTIAFKTNSHFPIYPHLVRGWVNIGDLDRAESWLLHWLKQEQNESEQPALPLQIRTIDMLLKAAAAVPKRNNNNNNARVEEIFLKLRECNVTPPVSAFFTVARYHGSANKKYNTTSNRIPEMLEFLEEAYQSPRWNGSISSYYKLKELWRNMMTNNTNQTN